MIRVNRDDIRRILRDLRQSPEEMRALNGRFGDVMAGQAGVEMANATNPPFFDDMYRSDAAFMVEKEVSDAFPPPSAIYDLVSRYQPGMTDKQIDKLRSRPSKKKVNVDGETLAKQWWAMMKRDPAKANRWLESTTGIATKKVARPNSQMHNEARTGKKGHVNKLWTERWSDVDAVDRFAAKKAKHVGLAKAAWLKAAQDASGKRSRAGGAAVGWVRKLLRSTVADGSLHADRTSWRVQLTSGITYASDAENPRLRKAVDKRLETRFREYADKTLSALARKMKMDYRKTQA